MASGWNSYSEPSRNRLVRFLGTVPGIAIVAVCLAISVAIAGIIGRATAPVVQGPEIPVPGPTVTLAVPGPTVTHTIPGPTITVTVTQPKPDEISDPVECVNWAYSWDAVAGRCLAELPDPAPVASPTTAAEPNRCPFEKPLSPVQLAEAGARCAMGYTCYCECV